MNQISQMELIEKARALLRPTRVGDYLVGDVGCALLTVPPAGSDRGNIYLGVCIDVGSGIGFCAEHSAIAAMVTAGEFRIQMIVAVWQDEHSRLHILSPCGRCREFIRQIHPANLDTLVILEPERAVKLSELLPYADWFQPVELD